MSIRTFRPNLKQDPTLPTCLWDPLWERPEVATRIATDTYRQLRLERDDFGGDGLLPPDRLPALARKNTEERAFRLDRASGFDGTSTRFRGGSYGEIFRRYTYGGARPAVNFHAQAVTFGVDSEGRYLLKAVVGRVDGGWGTHAALVLRFETAGGPLGGLHWQVELDPPSDVPMLLTGRSAVLAGAFDQLAVATVSFYSHPG